MATKTQIIEWVEKSLVSENFRNKDIRIIGTSEKDQGYLGDIVFVTVNGTTEDGKSKTLDLVVKHEKNNPLLKSTMPIKIAFDAELFVYDEVMPTFREFQSKKNVTFIFDSIPKCYYTVSSDELEALVLENLKAKGYEQQDRLKALDFNNCEKVLIEYGKLHAISFAMQKHEPEKFSKLRNGLSRFDTRKSLLLIPDMRKTREKALLDILEYLKENHQQLHEKLSKVYSRHPCDILLELCDQEISQSVVTHGDCWLNNFMFKYEEDNRTIPAKVAILDWQLSRVTSPVFDLSYFLYVVCSKQELDRFEDLLKAYYDSLVSHAAQMDCNVEQMFSYSDLKEHWKKYSIMGLTQVMFALKFALLDKEEAPSFGDVSEDKALNTMMDKISHNDSYYERILPVLRHYFDSTS